MLKETMAHAGLSIYTEIATVLVLALAAAILFYALVWRKKAYWQAASELPLSDGQERGASAAGAAGAATRSDARRAP